MTASAQDSAFDRALPQSADAERCVLGSLLLTAFLGVNVLARVSSIITPDDFAQDSHRSVFEAILELDTDGVMADLVVVKQRLLDKGLFDRAGGHAFISGLVDDIPDTANVEQFAKILRAKGDARRQIRAFSRGTQRLMDGARPEIVAADVAAQLEAVRSDIGASDTLLSLDDMAPRLEALYGGGGVEHGASTSWPTLDSLYTVATGAWTLVTGIPASGKSGVLDHLTINLAQDQKWQTVMFSAENFPPESHVASLIEKYLGEPFNEGPTARMTLRDMRLGLAFLERHFRFIDPVAERMSVDRILAIASALHEERPINALVIDPWNEVHHERPRELREDEYISASLTKVRRWARKHRAHVFIVVHPTKMQKGADGKYPVPTPYDCSGGAQWRNKADYCLTVHRELGEFESADVDIHVQKVRRREIGRLGCATLRYNKVTSQYEDPNARRMTFEERMARREIS